MTSLAKRAAIAAAFLLVAAVDARAADAPPTAGAFDWTGVYVGGSLGVHASYLDLSTTTDNTGGFFAPGAPAEIDQVSKGSLSFLGLIGGVQSGYNWQSGRYVFGIEADLNRLSGGTSRVINSFVAPVNPADFEINNFQPKYLATIRPRVGKTFDRTLVYATAGLALARIRTMDEFAGTGGLNVNSITAWTTKVGWTIGAGMECAIANNWSAKGEYLHADFGTFDTIGPGFPAIPTGNSIAFHHGYTENILRMGVNYRF